MYAFMPFLIFFAILVVSVFFTLQKASQAKKNLAQLASELGLAMESEGRYFPKHRVAGTKNGRRVTFFSYTTGAGKSRQTWIAVSTSVGPVGGLVFTLKRRVPVFEIFVRLFRKNGVSTGDPAFDRDWFMTTNQPDFMTAALLPELRERILNAGGKRYSTYIKLAFSAIEYGETGSFSDKAACERLAKMIGLLSDLATAVEVRGSL